jgi:hypothetical protein
LSVRFFKRRVGIPRLISNGAAGSSLRRARREDSIEAAAGSTQKAGEEIPGLCAS